MGQEENAPITTAEEEEMLRVVDDHQCVLNIKDSQEMMVGNNNCLYYDDI
jgi:hypothetical protein